MKNVKIPEPTIKRLPLYYQILSNLKEKGIAIVSSSEISNLCGVKASQFRKDVSYFGEFGIQGLGYRVSHLMEKISAIMYLNSEHTIALVGVGRLGEAFARYPGIKKWGFKIKYLFDKSPHRVGREINGIKIEHIENMPKPLFVSIGVITVPSSAAQGVADKLVDSGVKAILNFTSISLKVPEDVVVRNVDLTHELAILTYFLERRKELGY